MDAASASVRRACFTPRASAIMWMMGVRGSSGSADFRRINALCSTQDRQRLKTTTVRFASHTRRLFGKNRHQVGGGRGNALSPRDEIGAETMPPRMRTVVATLPCGSPPLMYVRNVMCQRRWFTLLRPTRRLLQRCQRLLGLRPLRRRHRCLLRRWLE